MASDDAIIWQMKALGSGALEPSQLAETLGSGVAKSRSAFFFAALGLDWSRFQGFIHFLEEVSYYGVSWISFWELEEN